MSDVFRTLYGDQFADKKEALEKRLDEIEEKHQDWFNERENRITGKKPDRLHNHYVFEFKPGFTRFAFLNDSDAPDYLQKECVDAFKEIFQA